MSDRGAGDRPALLTVGTLARVHGVRGELKLFADPEHVLVLRELAEAAAPITLRNERTGDEHEVTFAHVRGSDAAPIVKIDGVDDRTHASEFAGVRICIEREHLPEPDDDEYFLADLDGCEVIDDATGARVAIVCGVESLPANVVLTMQMDEGGARVLVPFIDDAVPEVDVEGRRMRVDLAFLGVDARGAEIE